MAQEKFIEITRANVVAGGASPAAKQMVGIAHIATIHEGSHNTAVIKLMTGEGLATMETYAQLKAALGT